MTVRNTNQEEGGTVTGELLGKISGDEEKRGGKAWMKDV